MLDSLYICFWKTSRNRVLTSALYAALLRLHLIPQHRAGDHKFKYFCQQLHPKLTTLFGSFPTKWQLIRCQF